jgi:glycosyltransferase involved in cell wall biosynthesis
MSDRRRVSVVVIFHDAERFLDEAIASVFAQTYPDWELLLVDDGSVDSGPTRAAAWAERAPTRVRCLAHPNHVNLGMSASRNLGIRHAGGECLAFLDADDVWLPGKLAQQVAMLEAWPEAAMVYGPTQWWYSWSGYAADRARDFVNPLGVPPDTLLQPPLLLARLLRNEDASPCTCSILVHRRVIEHVGGFEETFKGLYEDQAFCAKVCLSFPVVASRQCLYRYRQHAASACSVAERAGQARPARLRFLVWLGEYLSARDVEDAELWGILRRELWRTRHPVLQRGLGRTRRLANGLKDLFAPG